MEKEWVKIYTTTDFFQAELIRQVLEDREIKAVIMNKQDSSYRFGQIELYTHEKDKNTAISIIEELTKDGDSEEQ